MALALPLRLVSVPEAATAKLVQIGCVASIGLLIASMIAGDMSWWLVALIIAICVVLVIAT